MSERNYPKAEKLKRLRAIRQATERVRPTMIEDNGDGGLDSRFEYLIPSKPNLSVELKYNNVKVFILDENNSPVHTRPDFAFVGSEVRNLYGYVQHRYNLGEGVRRRTETLRKKREDAERRHTRRNRRIAYADRQARTLGLLDKALR